MINTKPVKNENKRGFNWSTFIFGYDFFISFKLGSPPIGAQSYASDLARRLRELGFTVFFSEEEAPPGAQLDSTLVKALKKSKILVVIANEGALVQSKWVRKEVEEFRRKRPNLPVIPINVDRAIETFGEQVDASKWLGHEGRIWLDETKEGLIEGIISPEVFSRLQLVPDFTKSNTRFKRAVAFIVLILIGLTAFAFYSAWDAGRKFKVASGLRLVSEGGSTTLGLKSGGTIKGLLMVLAGHSLGRSVVSYETLQSQYTKYMPLIYLRKQDDNIFRLALSPDGTHLVTSSSPNTSGNSLRLWDAKTGQPVGSALINNKISWITEIIFSSDSSRFITKDLQTGLHLWDARTGQPITSAFLSRDYRPFNADYSPDGFRIVSGSKDKNLQIWDGKTGKFIDKSVNGHFTSISYVSYSSNGSLIASGSEDGTIRLWDAKTIQPIGKPLRGNNEKVEKLKFSPDGKRLASQSKNDIFLWNDGMGKSIRLTLKSHESKITDFAFNLEGTRLVTCSEDKTLRLWSSVTGLPIVLPFQGHESWVMTFAFSPDGKMLVSGGDDKTLRLWDINTGHQIGNPFGVHESRILNVSFSPDGSRIVSGDMSGVLQMWKMESNLTDNEEQDKHTKHSTSSNKNIPGNNKQLAQSILKGHDLGVIDVVFSPDGKRLVSIGKDENIKIWNIENGQLIGSHVLNHKDKILSVALSPDVKYIITGSEDKLIRLWDVNNGIEIGKPYFGHKREVISVAFSPDGKHFVSGSEDNTLRVWDIKTGQAIRDPFEVDDEYWVNQVAYSPDGNRLASVGEDGEVILWDIKSGDRIGSPLRCHDGWATRFTFDPAGKRLAMACSNNKLTLSDVDSGELIGSPLEGHTGFITSLAFSPDGSYIVSGSQDKTLRLWYAATGQSIGTPLEGHESSITSARFSPDGKQIVSGSDDKSIRIWDVFEGWTDILCFKVGRNLSYKEWNSWVTPDIDYTEQCPDLPIPPDDLELAGDVETRAKTP